MYLKGLLIGGFFFLCIIVSVGEKGDIMLCIMDQFVFVDVVEWCVIKFVICYLNDMLFVVDIFVLLCVFEGQVVIDCVLVFLCEVLVICILVGQMLCIWCFEGLQVGDLNLFNVNDLIEWFYFGKMCVLYGIYVIMGDWLWFCFFFCG